MTVDKIVKPARALESYLGVYRYSRRAVQLVWNTHKGLTISLALLTIVAGLLPAGAAYVGKLIVDAVVAAIAVSQSGGVASYSQVLQFVLLEGLRAKMLFSHWSAKVWRPRYCGTAANQPAGRSCGGG